MTMNKAEVLGLIFLSLEKNSRTLGVAFMIQYSEGFYPASSLHQSAAVILELQAPLFSLCRSSHYEVVSILVNKYYYTSR